MNPSASGGRKRRDKERAIDAQISQTPITKTEDTPRRYQRLIPMNLIDTLERELGKKDLPPLHAGDTVEVHYLIREGEKERVQIYSGTIISISGRGIRKNICVRRIVQGEGVERIFPLHNPRVQDVVITRRGNVRRAKLFYLRDRVGKKTRVKELVGDKVRSERETEKARRADRVAIALRALDGDGLSLRSCAGQQLLIVAEDAIVV